MVSIVWIDIESNSQYFSISIFLLGSKLPNALCVNYLQTEPNVDLIFMDIQLEDGINFDIFEQVKVTSPVIFTTAFDQYTFKAFKVNSIDYLLKPIDEIELQQSLQKHQQLYSKTGDNFSDKLVKMLQDINAVKYKERLLIKRGQQLSYIKKRQHGLLLCRWKTLLRR